MTDRTDQNYIIYAPAFDENIGGIIFLHELVNTLNQLGERALIWPTPPSHKQRRRTRLKHALFPPPFALSPGLDTPLAKPSDLTARSIVVYPEITLGNPLGAKNVVRWLMYEPGLRNPYEFGPDEMFFRVGEMSDLPSLTGGAPDLSMWKVNRVYRNENREDRDGVCYIVRKGDHKPRIPETEAPDAIQVDGKSHAEINEILNRCHTFYSYDEATMYSQYAAICGCTSIVIPELYETRAEWVEGHGLARYGVAYGLDDVAHARATQDKVLGLLNAEESKGRASVEAFVKLTKARF